MPDDDGIATTARLFDGRGLDSDGGGAEAGGASDDDDVAVVVVLRLPRGKAVGGCVDISLPILLFVRG